MVATLVVSLAGTLIVTDARHFPSGTFWPAMLTLWRAPLPVLWRTSVLRRPAFLRWSDILSWTVIVAWPMIGTAHLSKWPLALIGLPIQGAIRLPVAWSRTDFEFVQLVPLFVSTIPLGDGKKFANPTTRIYS